LNSSKANLIVVYVCCTCPHLYTEHKSHFIILHNFVTFTKIFHGTVNFRDVDCFIFQDIWDMRMSKLRSSVDAFIKTGGSYAKLDHLTAMEINSIRPLLPHALDELSKLQKVVRIFMTFFGGEKKKSHIS